MSSLSRAIFFWRLSSRRSSLASISSCTSEAAVVKPTDSPLWQAASPRPSATWVLPVPLLPTAMTFSRRSTYSHRASCMTRCLFTDGIGQEVEGVEALGCREASSFDPALHHAMMAVYQLKLREPQQVAWVVDALGGALAGHLAVLSQERRQLQLLEVMLQQHRRPVAHRPLPDMSAM